MLEPEAKQLLYFESKSRSPACILRRSATDRNVTAALYLATVPPRKRIKAADLRVDAEREKRSARADSFGRASALWCQTRCGCLCRVRAYISTGEHDGGRAGGEPVPVDCGAGIDLLATPWCNRTFS
jgi:hypothetical protein